MSPQTHADRWPRSHTSVTSASSLSSTTTLAMSPSTSYATNHQSDRHSRPSSLGHKHRPGKRSRLYVAMAAANTRQAASKRHRATPSHFTTPHQLTPLIFSLPGKSSAAASQTSLDSESLAARLSCAKTCVANATPTHSRALSSH